MAARAGGCVSLRAPPQAGCRGLRRAWAATVGGAGALIDRLGRQRRWRQALARLGGMPRLRLAPSATTCAAAVGACMRGHCWEGAVACVRAACGRGLRVDAADLVSYNSALSACERAGRWAVCLQLLREARGVRLRPDAASFVTAARACEAGRWWSTSLALLREAAANQAVLNAAIAACGAVGRWRLALAVLEEMSAGASLDADLVSYGAAISAGEKAQQWAAALSLLRTLRASRRLPDVVALSAAASACEKGGRWEHAVELLRQARALALRPNAVALTAAASACGAVHRWQGAVHLAGAMLRSELSPDQVVFQAVSGACWAAGHAARAARLLRGAGRAAPADGPGGGALQAALLAEPLREPARHLRALALATAERGLRESLAEADPTLKAWSERLPGLVAKARAECGLPFARVRVVPQHESADPALAARLRGGGPAGGAPGGRQELP
ncbi:unnamed protein product [Prorocentrum cordatum]|uniref:Pentatricopeptide repeat-containing protein, chloroplastic n=1 Tax=Prorocentrum cordatum TaxID=2364126 RepID=A0ABN9PVU8_9DINO|nr:unnamed protein product [Polarella glacialis]